MKRIATVSPVWGCSVEDLRALAREAEAGGFEAIFSPEVPPYSAIANAQVFAEATSKIRVGTWITSIYMRQPVMCASEALTVQEVSQGRMVLGLGVSHKPVVTDRYGIDMGDPIGEMRKYVKAVRSFADGSSTLLTIKRQLPALPIYTAVLTEKAAELAGEVSDGIMPYMATPEYIKKLINAVRKGAQKAGRSPSDIDITNGIPSFISDDLEGARKAAKRGLSGYARFPYYQRLIKNIGFGDVIEKVKSGANPADALTDEFIEAVALVGSAGRCRERLEAFREAGVQLPIIVPNPVGKQGNVEVMQNTVKALAGS
jgi:alkanesulfonate monooxygenase SsuD/methylene tetrahydromethanopterin reductase-like flavin-dependent oxidoreductase (luciferase family)